MLLAQAHDLVVGAIIGAGDDKPVRRLYAPEAMEKPEQQGLAEERGEDLAGKSGTAYASLDNYKKG